MRAIVWYPYCINHLEIPNIRLVKNKFIFKKLYLVVYYQIWVLKYSSFQVNSEKKTIYRPSNLRLFFFAKNTFSGEIERLSEIIERLSTKLTK